MKYGDKGAAVKDMQQKLLKLGYELPKYGADSHFGDETREALKEYAKDHYLELEEETIKVVCALDLGDDDDNLTSNTVVEPETSEEEEKRFRANVVDLRSEQSRYPTPRKKWRWKRGKVVERDMSKVDGIVLHKTAVWYGVSRNQIRDAGGDKHKALHERGHHIACHAVAFEGKAAGLDCGHAIITNPLDWYINHGNDLNARSFGIEIEGRYKGLIKHGGRRASKEVVQAARDALRFLVEEGRRQGAPIKYIWAHRQSSGTRRDDPGEDLWKKVALDYGVKVLGLKTQPERTWDRGRPIPVEWDPENGKGRY